MASHNWGICRKEIFAPPRQGRLEFFVQGGIEPVYFDNVERVILSSAKHGRTFHLARGTDSNFLFAGHLLSLSSTKKMDAAPSFLEAYSGNIAGLATASGIYLVWYLITKKCKHSKCRSHTSCFDCSASEDEIKREKTRQSLELRKDMLMDMLNAGKLKVEESEV